MQQAGRVYGIGRERVRQILKEQGISTSTRPSQPLRTSGRELAGQDGLGPDAERMWRDGSSYGEVADALGVPRDAVQWLICERIPRQERTALIADKYDDETVTREQIIAALRDASNALGNSPGRADYERLRAQGLIDGPHGGLISQRLGWTNACQLAGLKPEPKNRPPTPP